MAIKTISGSSIFTGKKGIKAWDGKTLTEQQPSFEAIAAIEALGGVTSYTFSAIPQNYSHLQLRITSKCSRTNGNGDMGLQFNLDGAANYSHHRFVSNGSSVFMSSASITATSVYVGYSVGTYGNDATSWSTHIVDILEYSKTNKFKTVRSMGGNNQNGTSAPNGDVGNITYFSSMWRSTNAINFVTLLETNAFTFNPGTTIALYGVR
jgi:hypothetical protein